MGDNTPVAAKPTTATLNTPANKMMFCHAVATAWQNIILFAGVFNVAVVGLAATGVLSPIGAAVTHQLSSFLVMINSLRLLRVERTGTGWRASYRWQPVNTVTPVAVYDNFGQSAYLNLLIRQPIHCGHLLPNGTEALVDVRNLLAEGYRPFLTRDGSTLYFAQDERSIQGGLSFSF